MIAVWYLMVARQLAGYKLTVIMLLMLWMVARVLLRGFNEWYKLLCGP